jgi:hypothetical protein
VGTVGTTPGTFPPNITPSFQPEADVQSYAYTTVVGGTTLTTVSAGGAYSSESAWQGSGGGAIPNLSVPRYQDGLNLANRSVPDVSMNAAPNIYTVATVCAVTPPASTGVCPAASVQPQTPIPFGGTSASSPLWAGFTALMNEQAEESVPAQPSVGFLNPLLYRIAGTVGAGGTYTPNGYYGGEFNDIGLSPGGGNNANGCTTTAACASGSCFQSVPGWDGATGLGSPTCNLIQVATNFRQAQLAVNVDETETGPILCISGTHFTPGATVTIQYLGVPTGGNNTGNSIPPFLSQVADPFGNISLTDFSQEGPMPFLCSAAIEAGVVTVLATDGKPPNGSGNTSATVVAADLWCGAVVHLGPMCEPPAVPDCGSGDVACGAGCCPAESCQSGSCCATPLCGGECCEGGSCLNDTCCAGAVVNGECCAVSNVVCDETCCPQGNVCVNGGGCCPSDQACGASGCCGDTEVCVNDTCEPLCPTGQAACLSEPSGAFICCATGDTCTPAGCAPMTCPTGQSACQPMPSANIICCTTGDECSVDDGCCAGTLMSTGISCVPIPR